MSENQPLVVVCRCELLGGSTGQERLQLRAAQRRFFPRLQASVTASCDTKRLSLRVVQGSTVPERLSLRVAQGSTGPKRLQLRAAQRGFYGAMKVCLPLRAAQGSTGRKHLQLRAAHRLQAFVIASRDTKRLSLQVAQRSTGPERLPLRVAQGSTGPVRLQLRAAQRGSTGL